MKQFLDRCSTKWSAWYHMLSATERRFNEGFYRRFPRVIGLGGWLLRGLYAIVTSPAFAVILSLLLVGLVISDVVPLILSISVFLAWVVASLSIAKADSVQKFSILRRFGLVLGVAVLMAWAANSYVKWCLINYYKKHPDSVKADTAHGKGGETVAPDRTTDSLALDRMKILLEQELPKYVQIPPAKRTPEIKADVVIDFAGISDLQVMFRNNASVPAQKPKHWFGMVDATNMFTYPNKPEEYQPLPLQTRTWSDYLRSDTPSGPYSVLSESPSEIARTHVQKGDVIVGVISCTCENCVTVHRYYVYFKLGEGGWYYTIPKARQDVYIPMPTRKEIPLEELNAYLDKQIPTKDRVRMKAKFF